MRKPTQRSLHPQSGTRPGFDAERTRPPLFKKALNPHRIPWLSITAEQAQVAALCSTILLVTGLAFSGASSVVPTTLLAAAALIALLVGLTRVVGRSSPAASHEDLDDNIERLEDLRWRAHDDSLHLQALLDGQADIILQRDRSGRISFANRSFENTFGYAPRDILGRSFHPRILERCNRMPAVPVAGTPDWAEPGAQRLQTSKGPRWIEWTHHVANSPMAGDGSIQSIGRDITEQRRHEETLAEARDAARSADRAKSRFLASMSHEIRTPMNGILGMSGLLEETLLTPEQRTYNVAVRKSATTLLALIDEILDFSKIEAGHLQLSQAPFDIVECVQSVVELLAPRAYEKNLQIAWSTAPDMPAVFIGDEARLRQILLNLIGNALKYTSCGGVSIWVGTEPADDGSDTITIVVRDTGPGIAEAARARIFMEFERAVPEGVTQESGTGLGLAIASRLATSMGGVISLRSEPGDGATFALTITLERGTEADTRQPTANQMLAGRHVALVSSKIIERKAIANFLRSWNLAVTEFGTAVDLKRSAPHHDQPPFDTLFIDCDIPVSDVRQAIDALASDIALAAVIAPAARRNEFERFRDVGVPGYLVRPVRPSTLLAMLRGEIAVQSSVVRSMRRPPTDPEQAHQPRRILVAEDNDINALLTRTVLERLGCLPLVVGDGEAAISALAQSLEPGSPGFDAILMDLHMPGIDGFAATLEIQRLCAKAGVAAPVVIAVTANAFEDDRRRCLDAGMDDYLSKPFEPADLQRVLGRCEQRRHIEQQD